MCSGVRGDGHRGLVDTQVAPADGAFEGAADDAFDWGGRGGKSVVGGNPGDVAELLLEKLVAGEELDVVPVVAEAGLGQRDRQLDQVC